MAGIVTYDTIIVQQGQCLLDIALQEYGSAEGVVMLMRDNGLELDADIAPGTSLVIRNTPINKAVKEYFASKRIKVASAVPLIDLIGCVKYYRLSDEKESVYSSGKLKVTI